MIAGSTILPTNIHFATGTARFAQLNYGARPDLVLVATKKGSTNIAVAGSKSRFSDDAKGAKGKWSLRKVLQGYLLARHSRNHPQQEFVLIRAGEWTNCPQLFIWRDACSELNN